MLQRIKEALGMGKPEQPPCTECTGRINLLTTWIKKLEIRVDDLTSCNTIEPKVKAPKTKEPK